MSAGARRGAVLGMLAALAAGCGGPAPLALERSVGGQRRLGPFVAPHSYEHFVLAELARLRGDHRAAIEHYEQARAGAADDPLLLARIADEQDRLGDRDAAERALAEGERLDPSAQAIWMARGEIAERHGETARAIEAYARAMDLAEHDEAPVLALVRLLRQLGASERAEAVLQAWLARSSEGIGTARARLALALGRGDAQAAGFAALELARRSPAHADEVAASARALLDAGHPTLAHRLLSLLPDDAVPHVLRLEAALAAGDGASAEALLTGRLPSSGLELVAAARAWLELGDPEQAAELAEVALARGAGADARLVLAQARLRQGRFADAAAIAAAIPAQASVAEQARAVLSEALQAAGLSALAAEVRAHR